MNWIDVAGIWAPFLLASFCIGLGVRWIVVLPVLRLKRSNLTDDLRSAMIVSASILGGLFVVSLQLLLTYLSNQYLPTAAAILVAAVTIVGVLFSMLLYPSDWATALQVED